jgi:hypothetical protein
MKEEWEAGYLNAQRPMKKEKRVLKGESLKGLGVAHAFRVLRHSGSDCWHLAETIFLKL